jgi:hypothetical protein
VSFQAFYPFEGGWIVYAAWAGCLTILLLLFLLLPIGLDRKQLGQGAKVLSVLGAGGLIAMILACGVKTIQQALFLHPGPLGDKISEIVITHVTQGWSESDMDKAGDFVMAPWHRWVALCFFALWGLGIPWISRRMELGHLLRRLRLQLFVAAFAGLVFFVLM